MTAAGRGRTTGVRRLLPAIAVRAAMLATAPLAGAAGAAGVAPPGYACAAPVREVSPDVPWPQRRLGFARVWPLSRGAGVTVAVIDSGVDGRTPQLAGRVDRGLDVVNGGGRADTDCVGHGTAVAAIIAAAPWAGSGFVGVAPAARILPIRQADAGRDGTAAGLAAAIRAAVDRGARVINVSVVTAEPSTVLRQAVGYAAARDALIVAAVANEAQAGNPRTYPASYPGVLGVAAVGPDDRNTDFSETGDFVGVAAPGVDVVTVAPGGAGGILVRGTSYAAPFVSGVAALLRGYHPRWTAEQVRRQIEQTADHPAARLPDAGVGWGVVDPYAAIASAPPGTAPAARAPAALAARRPAAPVPPGPGQAALLGAAGLVAAAVLLLAGRAVGRHGTARHWRPAPPGRPALSTSDEAR